MNESWKQSVIKTDRRLGYSYKIRFYSFEICKTCFTSPSGRII